MSATAEQDVPDFLKPSVKGDVHGRMYGFATQFSLPADDYVLRGEVAFPWGVELGLQSKRLYRAQVAIRRRRAPPPKPSAATGSDAFPFPEYGSREDQLDVTQDHELLPNATVYLELDEKSWDTLARSLTADSYVDFTASLKPFSQDSTHCTFAFRLNDALRVTVRAPSEGSQLKGARYRELEDAFQGFVLSGGQVLSMCREIAESASAQALSRQEAMALIEKVGSLVADLRSAMRPDESIPGHQFGTMWLLSPKEFEQAISGYDAEKQSSMRRQYDTVWLHYDSALAMAEGEKKYGAPKDGFQPKVDELEVVARQYLSLPAGRSPYLEWALIDALLYCECIAYAQNVLSEKTFLGVKVASELTGAATSFRRSAKELGKLALRGVGELLTVAATHFVALIVTDQNTQSAWVVTTGITAARWIRKAIILTQAKPPEQIQYRLLSDMSSVQRMVMKVPDFSAAHLLDQLNRLSEKGAVFSPLVYRLLDKRQQSH